MDAKSAVKVFVRPFAGHGATTALYSSSPFPAEEIVQAARGVGNAAIQKGEDGRNLNSFSASLLTGTTFFGNRMCPYCDRVMWAAYEKGLFASGAMDFVHINMGKWKQPWFQKEVYSVGAIPALADGGMVLGESALLVEYVANKFRGVGPDLLPADPRIHLLMQRVVKSFDRHAPLADALYNREPATDAAKLAAAVKFVQAVNTEYARVPSAGPFLLGETPCVADMVVLPVLMRFHLGLLFFRSFDLLPEGDVRVARVATALRAALRRPAFLRTLPPYHYILASQWTAAGGILPEAAISAAAAKAKAKAGASGVHAPGPIPGLVAPPGVGAGVGAGAGAGAGSSEDAKAHGYDYDLVVIGGGSGGLSCAKHAKELGAKVALLDFVKPSPQGSTWGLGGTCVNVGCIPKKLMHTAALLGEGPRDAKLFGWQVADATGHDWDALVTAVQDHIKSLNLAYLGELRTKDVTYLNCLGSFIDPHTVDCVNKKGQHTSITAANVVVAVGGRPKKLGIPGEELAITSDDLFSLDHPPGKTLCIGASYVSLECAGFLTGLGYDTSVMVRSVVLREFDQDCATQIREHMVHLGTRFLDACVPLSIEAVEGRKRVHYKRVSQRGGAEAAEVLFEDFDTVLVAIGRYADLEGLALDKAGVAVGKDGKLECAGERTNVPHIYGIGDVLSGRPELTPVAIRAGRLLADRLFSDSTEQMDYHKVPTTVFTPLEYGSIGYSEEVATSIFGEENIQIFSSKFVPLEWSIPASKGDAMVGGRALLNLGGVEDDAKNPREHDRAYAKIICDKDDDLRVVGFHYLGPHAGEVTQGFGVALKLGATFASFAETVGIHPTAAETFTTLSGAGVVKTAC